MAETLTAAEIKAQAAAAGFSLTGVAPLRPSPELEFFGAWLDQGYAGEMRYLERQRSARLHPNPLLDGVRSVIVCAVNYNSPLPLTSTDRFRAWVSRYAWGTDYHETLRHRLEELARWIESRTPARTRAFVDTGPVNERVFAKYAGIGWFGKNTCIINEKLGSWLFLGCILTDAELEYGAAPPDRCGSCTRCLDACPTQAFVAPYVLDSRKCISYATIELRGEIPGSVRDGIGHHLFGCDICQDVCPWNRKAPVSHDPAFQPRDGLFWPAIESLLELTPEQWQTLIRHTSLKRAKLHGLLRNLMVVAGNSGVVALAGKVRRFLDHEDEHVRSHAAWALKKLKEPCGPGAQR